MGAAPVSLYCQKCDAICSTRYCIHSLCGQEPLIAALAEVTHGVVQEKNRSHHFSLALDQQQQQQLSAYMLLQHHHIKRYFNHFVWLNELCSLLLASSAGVTAG